MRRRSPERSASQAVPPTRRAQVLVGDCRDITARFVDRKKARIKSDLLNRRETCRASCWWHSISRPTRVCEVRKRCQRGLGAAKNFSQEMSSKAPRGGSRTSEGAESRRSEDERFGSRAPDAPSVTRLASPRVSCRRRRSRRSTHHRGSCSTRRIIAARRRARGMRRVGERRAPARCRPHG
jgi:hypothetical protein